MSAVAEGPVLLTCSAGGHFTELGILAHRRGVGPGDRVWTVPRTAQTEAALRGEQVAWMPRVAPRDAKSVLRELGTAIRLHRRLRPRLVLSSGAAQAVPHLLAAAFCGTRIEYVESVARSDRPSTTGRFASLLPRTTLSYQATGWHPRWKAIPDVFETFVVETVPPAVLTSATVSLGSERFPFPRAVELVRSGLPAHVQVTWQTGTTTVINGPRTHQWMTPEELSAAMDGATVVIVHGGAGSVLTALQSGRTPIVIPRRASHGEHVDDHQVTMCERLAERGLVVLVREGEGLTPEHLLAARRRRVRRLTAQA